MVDIVAATRNDANVLMGVSPRGTLALLHAAKAYAYLQGRAFVTPDDVKTLAVPVLAHRIVMGFGQLGDGKEFVKQILATVAVPTEEFAV
jgi:MoxR-like ATPase